MEIKFTNVDYVYNLKSPLEKIALLDINMEFKQDMINGIIGKSGSGKTTLIEMINALILPVKGNVKVGSWTLGRNRKLKNINRLRYNIGLVFQFPEEQFFCKTVYQEIEFGMKYFKIKTENISKRISDSLAMVGLDDSFLGRNPFSLSSGEMRKVAIASILAFNPRVVILDEPTIGLDNESKENLIKVIRRLKNDYKKTVIIVTHDVDLLHKIADYIFVLDKAHKILEGTKYEVFTNQMLSGIGIKPPKIIEFEQLVLSKKNIKLGYRDDINDLMKDVYRHVK